MRSIALILAIGLLGACATPVRHTDVPLSHYDKNTEYGVEDRPDGFGIAVYYSRYQFIPESDAVALACKSALMAIAWEVADQKGRQIKPLNEQRIRLSMGRNGFTGITSCRAFGVAKWAHAAEKYATGD